MPYGPQLIEVVARCMEANDEVSQFGLWPAEIVGMLGPHRSVTPRSIRYAIAELIKQGRAKRKGQQGPVYAVREE